MSRLRINVLVCIPEKRLIVDESITSTIVDSMQIEASPAPFLFIRYVIPETDTK